MRAIRPISFSLYDPDSLVFSIELSSPALCRAVFLQCRHVARLQLLSSFVNNSFAYSRHLDCMTNDQLSMSFGGRVVVCRRFAWYPQSDTATSCYRNWTSSAPIVSLPLLWYWSRYLEARRIIVLRHPKTSPPRILSSSLSSHHAESFEDFTDRLPLIKEVRSNATNMPAWMRLTITVLMTKALSLEKP